MKKSQNMQKHENKNPLLKFLLEKFYLKVNQHINESGSPKKVLDAGCGEGFAIRELGKALKGSNIFGVDQSKDALITAGSVAPEMKTKKANVERLPFESNSFDLVLALEILEHLQNPKQGLKELKRVCKTNCIISVPNEPWFSLCNVLRLKNLKRMGKNPEHLHFWRKKEISELVGKFFEIKKISVSFPWLIFSCKK